MKTKALFFALLIFAATAAAGWYFLYGQILASAGAASRSAATESTASATAAQDQALAAFLATASSTASTILGSVVPAEGSVAFIGRVEGLAKAATIGLRVQSVGLSPATAVSPAASTADFDTLNLSLAIQGSWSAVYRFMSMLETLPYESQVANITLNQSVFSAPGTNGKPGPAQSFWSGSLNLLVLKNTAPEDSVK